MMPLDKTEMYQLRGYKEDAMPAETPEEWADHIAELVTLDGRKAEIIHAIEWSVRAERDRCEALVQAARLEPTDLRSIAHMIRNPSPK